MSRNVDQPWQIHVLKNYNKGKILKAWNTLRKLANNNNMNNKKKWKWAVNGKRIYPNDAEVKRLKAEYERGTAPKPKSKKKVKGKDTRTKRDSRGRFVAGFKPPPPRKYNRDDRGRFVKENLLELTLLNQSKSTPERDARRAQIEKNLTQPTDQREVRIQTRLHEELTDARRERDAVQRLLQQARNQLNNMEKGAGSSTSTTTVTTPEQKERVRLLEERLRKAEEEVAEAGDAIFTAEGRRNYKVTNDFDSSSDDGNFNDGNFNDGGDSSDGGSFSDSQIQGPMMTPTATNTQPNAPLLDEIVEPNLRNSWTNRYEIDGVNRSPIKLKTMLKWLKGGKRLTEWRFCDGLRRAQAGLKQRPHSFYTKFLSAHNAKIFDMVRRAPLDTFGIAGRNITIMWAKKSLYEIANPDFFGVTEIPGNDNGLKPVLYDPQNYYLQFQRPQYSLIHPVIAQASAVTATHVILVTADVGKQMIKQPPLTLYTDDNERYKIDVRKLIEIMFLMCAYNKQKAKIVSFFDPHPIISAVDHLVKEKYPNGIPDDTIIYKPWFDYENDKIATLLNKPIQTLRHAWYEYCWSLNIDDGLEGQRTDWDPAKLGDGTRGDIYEEGVIAMDDIYNEFISEWGQVNGDAIVEARTTEPLNTPLIAFERLDDVFTPSKIRDIIQRFQNRMNNENSELRSNNLGPLGINLLAVGKDMYTALYTKRIRNVKRGIVVKKEGDNYKVQWDLPDGEFDGPNVVNPVRMLSLDDIVTRQRMAAAFFLKQIIRMKPLWYQGNEDAGGVKLLDRLRTGDALGNGWTEVTNGETKLHRRLHEGAIRDFVTIEIALPTLNGSKNLLQKLLDQFNRIEEVPCSKRGDQTTVAKGVKRVLQEIETFFKRNENEPQVGPKECVNFYCSVLRHGQNY